MEFHDEQLAKDYLSCVSYFRLKYFWIDMIDEVSDFFIFLRDGLRMPLG